MRLTLGQAARKGASDAAGRAGRLAHRLVQLALVLGIVFLAAVAVLAIRLAQGPLPIAGLARQIAIQASDAGQTVSIGGAELTWQGLHGGLDRPLDIVLRDVALRSASGETILSVTRAEVSLSLLELLIGRVTPRAVLLDQPILNLDIAGDDTSASAPSDWRAQLANILLVMRSPVSHIGGVSSKVGQLRRIKLNNAQLALHDATRGLHGNLTELNIDMLRASRGGANLKASATLNLGGGQVAWRTTGELLAASGDLVLGLTVDRFSPAWLAADMALLAPLNLMQMPLSITGTAQLGPTLALRMAALDIVAERGSLLIGDGVMPLRHATLHADITPDTLAVQLRDAVLQATETSTPTHLAAQIDAKLTGAARDQLAADVSMDLDQVLVDDLPALWPLGIGGPGTRPWLVVNAHNGTLRNGHVTLSLTAPTDFSDAVMTKISGGIDGTNVSVSWLAPVPPVEHTNGHLVFIDPDTLDIMLTAGQQAGTQLVTKQGKLRLTGLAGHDQFLALDTDLSGPFADLLRLLHHKRIGLLDKRPIPINDPTGQITGKLTVAMPLKNSLDMDDVALHGVGQLTDAHIGGIAAGRDLDHATMRFDVSNTSLTLGGNAEVASVPIVVNAVMDFRPGGAAQVLEKVDVNASFTGEQLTKLNANPDQMLSGSGSARLTYQERRNGKDDLAISVDITNTAIAHALLAWTKPAGAAGQATFHAEMRAGQIVAIDELRANAPGLVLRSHASTELGKPNMLLIDALKIGQTTDISGTIRLPAKPGAALDANLSGPALDVSGLLARRDTDHHSKGPAYHINLHVDRMTMANKLAWKDVTADLSSDGWITTQANVSALAGSGKMNMRITQRPTGRSLQAAADDAGAMLTALDISTYVEGGSLAADGQYDDSNAAHTLSGTATMENFRLPNAPVIGQLLQALSVYGIFEATSGAGLAMTRLTAPFELTTDALILDDARAVSASLGFTAKGKIDLNANAAQLEGTVIPLYFFNSLLGRLPLIGKLFSPEAEGGLLAMGFSIRGNLDDPAVTVNPLSALTPGFLRRFFDIFPPSANASPPSPVTP